MVPPECTLKKVDKCCSELVCPDGLIIKENAEQISLTNLLGVDKQVLSTVPEKEVQADIVSTSGVASQTLTSGQQNTVIKTGTALISNEITKESAKQPKLQTLGAVGSSGQLKMKRTEITKEVINEQQPTGMNLDQTVGGLSGEMRKLFFSTFYLT